jgi:hypothetical protein
MYKVLRSGRHGLITWCNYNHWVASGYKGSWFGGFETNPGEVYFRLFGLEVTFVP